MNDAVIEFRETGFGYVNHAARIVIVGITPGVSQLVNDRSGKSPREIKRENAFAGRMRPNLIRMLDYVGVNRLLGIESCATLWSCDFDKVEMTSLLKEATFVKGKMFNNPALIAKSAKLTAAFNEGFKRDCASYLNAVLFVACGNAVGSVISGLKADGIISAEVISIPHPSGANAGRIAAFLNGDDDSLDTACRVAREQARIALRVVNSMCKKISAQLTAIQANLD